MSNDPEIAIAILLAWPVYAAWKVWDEYRPRGRGIRYFSSVAMLFITSFVASHFLLIFFYDITREDGSTLIMSFFVLLFIAPIMARFMLLKWGNEQWPWN